MPDRDLEEPSPFDRTAPTPSRWDQQGAEYVRDNAEWVARCAMRMTQFRSDLNLAQAHDLAQELSLEDNLRARSPELVGESMTVDTQSLKLFDGPEEPM